MDVCVVAQEKILIQEGEICRALTETIAIKQNSCKKQFSLNMQPQNKISTYVQLHICSMN